jgi:hypothetical protein
LRVAVTAVRNRNSRQTYLSDSSDVLVAIFLAKSQVLVQAKSDVVAVEPVGSETQVQQVLLQSRGDGGFTGCAETSEPDGHATLLAELVALAPRERRVPCDVTTKAVSDAILIIKGKQPSTHHLNTTRIEICCPEELVRHSLHGSVAMVGSWCCMEGHFLPPKP